MQSATKLASNDGSIAPARGPRIDFQVMRTEEALSSIQAVSERARLAASHLFPSGGLCCAGDIVVTDHRASNDLLYRLRQRGFAILYIGPAGPIEI